MLRLDWLQQAGARATLFKAAFEAHFSVTVGMVGLNKPCTSFENRSKGFSFLKLRAGTKAIDYANQLMVSIGLVSLVPLLSLIYRERNVTGLQLL